MTMEWCDIYTANDEPSPEQVGVYANSDLWWELCEYLEEQYGVGPRLSYSHGSVQRGWNIRYQCGGRSLCTLYPREGAFIALVVMGADEQSAADALIGSCSEYTQRLYRETAHTAGGRWLMFEVRDDEVLEDVKRLVGVRVPVV